MSAIVAYQSLLRRVTLVEPVTPVRGGADRAAKQSSSGSPIVVSAGPASSALMALLGRTGLSGPDGTTVPGTTDTTAAPAEGKAKLQHALSTLLDVLNRSDDDPATPEESAPAVDEAIQTILTALTPVAAPTAAAGGTAALPADPPAAAGEAATPKPNLDALNRVLTHYTTQSAAASTVVTLVR